MSATRNATFRVAIAALIGAATAGAVLQAAAWIARGGEELDPWWWWLSLFASALAGGLAAGAMVRRSFGGRLEQLAQELDGKATETDFLKRLPDMGEDEVGRIARSFNRVLARMTSLESDAIDRNRELEVTQRSLRLAEQLGEKQRELETRLKERALLFELLRESTATHDLDRVLEVLVNKIGPALRASQLAVLLTDGQGGYHIRAAWGFEHAVVGQALRPPSEGPWSLDGGVVLVPDIAQAPDAIDFWDDLPRTGSFAAVPIHHQGEEIGLLVLTRPDHDPLSEIAARYLEAVASQAALAIHNAQLVERLEALSTRDELTGLPNRRLFTRRFERCLARARRYGHDVSVLVLDIDHFKRLNDAHGHPAGDAALVSLARAIKASIREVDTAARVGGEEFWILLPQTGAAEAELLAEALRTEVAALQIPGSEDQPLGYFSCSIGVATRSPEEDQAGVLARADAALYQAKRQGRDRVVTSPGAPSDPTPAD